jgi:hypothetical protein
VTAIIKTIIFNRNFIITDAPKLISFGLLVRKNIVFEIKSTLFTSVIGKLAVTFTRTSLIWEFFSFGKTVSLILIGGEF